MGNDLAGQAPASRGEQAAHISREMVKLMRDIVGRGPTKARTTIARDHVLVMFQETLTQGERNLIDNGYVDQVEAVRGGYQEVLEDRAVKLIEATLDRKVIGFMSTNHFEPDLAAEVFVLESSTDSPGGGPEEAEHAEA